MDKAFLNLAGGLLVLIISNILLGSVDALLNKTFNTVAFFKGVGKGTIIILATAGVYFAGTLNPDIVAITLGGQELTILSAINLLILTGYFFYAKQVLEKLAVIFKFKVADADKQ